MIKTIKEICNSVLKKSEYRDIKDIVSKYWKMDNVDNNNFIEDDSLEWHKPKPYFDGVSVYISFYNFRGMSDEEINRRQSLVLDFCKGVNSLISKNGYKLTCSQDGDEGYIELNKNFQKR